MEAHSADGKRSPRRKKKNLRRGQKEKKQLSGGREEPPLSESPAFAKEGRARHRNVWANGGRNHRGKKDLRWKVSSSERTGKIEKEI